MKSPIRLLVLLLVVSWAVGPTLLHAQVDQKKLDAAIESVAKAAPALTKWGQAAARPLRRATKANESIGYALKELRTLARASSTEGPGEDNEAETKKMEADVDALVKALLEVAEFKAAASDSLTKAALAQSDAFAKTALDRMDIAIYMPEAKAYLQPFLTKGGTYLGMFAPLAAKQRAKMAEAYLAIFLDGAAEPGVRRLAADGVSELAEKGDKKFLDRLRVIAESKEEKDRDATYTAQKTMARLGDDSFFAPIFKTWKDALAAETKKGEKANVGVILQCFGQLAQLHQDIYQFRETSAYYFEYLRILLPAPYDKLDAQLRDTTSNYAYNLACALSRLNLFEDALWALDISFSYGGQNFDWAGEDGDLANLRTSEGKKFAAVIAAYREGKKKKGEFKFSWDAFAKHVAGVNPDLAKQIGEALKRAESQPTSRPDSQPTSRPAESVDTSKAATPAPASAEKSDGADRK